MGNLIVGRGKPDDSIGEVGDSYIDEDTYNFYVGKKEPGQDHFFGINTHMRHNYPPYNSMGLSDYQYRFADMGVQTYRTNVCHAQNVIDDGDMINQLAADGYLPMIVVDQGVPLDHSYEQNYDEAYRLAISIGTEFVGSPVKLFEWSNEIDHRCRIDESPNPYDGKGVDGSIYQDFDDVKFDAWRGWMRGGIDGLKSLIPDAVVGYASGNCFAHIPARMMLFGLDSNGNATREGVPIDMANPHWYSSMHNIEDAYTHHDDQQEGINIMQEMQDIGLPFYITEWGAYLDEQGQADYAADQYPVWMNAREKYPLFAGVYFYVLFADANDSGTDEPCVDGVSATNYGTIQANGKTYKKVYDVLRSFHQSNWTPAGDAWGEPRYLPPSETDVFAVCGDE